MHIDALSDVVIIRRSEPETVSSGGVLLAYDPDFKEDIGVVEFVGRGKLKKCAHCGESSRVPVDVRVGDKVLFSTNGHQIVTVAQQEFVVLREPSIIAVIEGGE